MPIPAGNDLVVSVDEFSTYLNNPNMDYDRAVLILGLAQKLCQTVVSPLPAGSDIVVLDVAERAYSNPTTTGRSSAASLYTEGEGLFSDVSPGTVGGGLYLTANNERILRNLAGAGGAFTIDTLPATFTPSLPWWDTSAADGGWDSPPT